MDTSLLLKSLKAVFPLLLGAIGGVVAAAFPVYHGAFCAGGF